MVLVAFSASSGPVRVVDANCAEVVAVMAPTVATLVRDEEALRLPTLVELACVVLALRVSKLPIVPHRDWILAEASDSALTQRVCIFAETIEVEAMVVVENVEVPTTTRVSPVTILVAARLVVVALVMVACVARRLRRSAIDVRRLVV